MLYMGIYTGPDLKTLRLTVIPAIKVGTDKKSQHLPNVAVLCFTQVTEMFRICMLAHMLLVRFLVNTNIVYCMTHL